jgi:hypothetical protein
MSNHTDVRCHLAAEYVDEAAAPEKGTFHPGEVVRPHVVAQYIDLWHRDDEITEFTVLLKDGRFVSVRGHSLKHWPSTVPGESGSYGVSVKTAGEEILVALFRCVEVVGIFRGEMHSSQQIA